MARLSVFWPVKPLVVTQAFGIFNPAYKQFGFTKHNGIDLAVGGDRHGYAMMDAYVLETGKNDGAGNFVVLRTVEPVEAEGRTALVALQYMHAEKVLVEKGQMVKAGDPVIVCDNTGFSTGEHLHVSAYFVDERGKKIKQGDVDANYCFDWSKYCNNYFAVDAQKVLVILHKLKALLLLWLAKL